MTYPEEDIHTMINKLKVLRRGFLFHFARPSPSQWQATFMAIFISSLPDRFLLVFMISERVDSRIFSDMELMTQSIVLFVFSLWSF